MDAAGALAGLFGILVAIGGTAFAVIASCATPLMLAVLFYAIWKNTPKERMRRALAGAPRARFAEVRDGQLVKLVGRVVLADSPLVGPLSNRQCAMYEAIVEEYRRGSKSSSWQPRHRERRMTEFLLEGDSGRVRVPNAARFETTIVDDHHLTEAVGDDGRERIAAFLVSRKVETVAMTGSWWQPLRYREGVIEHGELIVVVGIARWESDPQATGGAGYRDGARRLVLEPPRNLALLVSDDPDLLRA